MQPSPQFNTHYAIKAIMATGLNESQAEAVVNAIVESKQYDLANLATKTDIALLRTDIEKFKNEILKWGFTSMVGMTGIIIAAIELMK
jgi:hypothetical protein